MKRLPPQRFAPRGFITAKRHGHKTHKRRMSSRARSGAVSGFFAPFVAHPPARSPGRMFWHLLHQRQFWKPIGQGNRASAIDGMNVTSKSFGFAVLSVALLIGGEAAMGAASIQPEFDPTTLLIVVEENPRGTVIAGRALADLFSAMGAAESRQVIRSLCFEISSRGENGKGVCHRASVRFWSE